MDSLEFLVKKHDAEIMDIKNCLMEMSSNITLMLNENKHINSKLSDLISVTDDVREMTFTIKSIQTLYIEMKAKIETMNINLRTLESRIDSIERNSNKFTNLLRGIRDYWPIIIVLAAGFGALLEWVYKNRIAG